MKNNILRKIAGLFTLTFLFAATLTCTVFAAEEVEPNNSSNEAAVIETDVLYTGSLNTKNDIDWYEFTPTGDYFKFVFDIDYQTAGVDALGDGYKITICSGNGTNVLRTYKDVLSGFETPQFPYTDKIYVKVEADYTYSAPLNCPYKFRIDSYTDSYWESEWNDTSATPNEIKPGIKYTGSLNSYNDVDWYLVDTKTGAFNVALSADPSISADAMYDGWKVSIYTYGYASPFVTYEGITSEVTSFDIPYKGKILIKVEADYLYGAPVDCLYNLTVSQHDKSKLWESEANDTMDAANVIKNGKTYSGNLYKSTDADYFKYQAPCYGVATFEFSRDISDSIKDGWKVTVMKSDATVVYEKIVQNDIAIKEQIAFEKGETYYIKVAADWSYSAPTYINYKVGFNFKVKTQNVSGLKATPSTNSIKLSWDKVKGSEGYKVYVYNTKTKTYDIVKTTTSKKCTITGLNPGTNYTYYVKAYQVHNNKQYHSAKYTKIETATKPVATSKVWASSRTTSSITLKWNKVSGATGYRVYKYNANTKKWESVKTLTSTSYTVKNLTAGNTYSFKVKAYKAVGDIKIWGAASESFKTATKPAATTQIKVSSRTMTSIKLTWNKVSGATGYRVYKYNADTKKWESLTTTTSTSYNVKNLKAGTTYKFKVKAYKTVASSKIWGEASSSYKHSTKPGYADVKSLSAGKGNVKVRWNKVTGATGYIIEYSKSEYFYSKELVTVRSSSAVSKTISSLESGERYYFRIRAYKVVDDKTIYGEYGDVRSVKTK